MNKKEITKKSVRISPGKFLKVVKDYVFLFEAHNYNYFKHTLKDRYIKVKNNVYGE